MKKFHKRHLEKKLLLKSETLRHLDLSVVTGVGEKEDEEAALACPMITCPGCSITVDGYD